MRPTPAFRSAFVAAVVVLLAVSGGMLWDLGYNYDGLTGSPVTKLHPFTYFVFAALAWRALQSGDPIGFASVGIAQRPAAAWLLALSFLLVLATALRSGPGLAGNIDTFGSAAALALILKDYDEADIRPLTVVLHVVMTVNALMGLAEFAS